MIDLSPMRSVRINPKGRRAFVEPGATLGDFDHEAQVFGLATPLGINSTTGVAGLTLGGGFGWLSRKYGMSVDNLVSADVVTAEGRLVRASASENPDLFWGLRGGGGNFGVVTSFQYQLHPVKEILGGLVAYPAEDASDTQNAFGVDDGFEGLNVTSIAMEIPISLLPPTVGMYASTSRQRNRHFKSNGQSSGSGEFVQIARLANPLVNEVIIGTGAKDFWNSQEPEDEQQFLGFYKTSRLAVVLNALFGTSFPATNRNDLVAVLLQYFPPVFSGPPGALSELLRVNLAVPPTPPASQKRLTVLTSGDDGHGQCVSTFDPGAVPDLAGWPNGRRPNDDVTDVALRVVAGALLGPVPCLGDGVNVNRVRAETPNLNPGNNVSLVFPFLPTPNPGRSGTPPATTPFPTGPNEPLFR